MRDLAAALLPRCPVNRKVTSVGEKSLLHSSTVIVCPFPRVQVSGGALLALSVASFLPADTSEDVQTSAPLPTTAALANQDRCQRRLLWQVFCCSDASFARSIRYSPATASS